LKIIIADKSRLRDAARNFLKETAGKKLFAFYGQMGSGKTTFIRALCHEMGVADTVTSPTFTLVNEYRRPGSTPVYHFDFFRIKNITEVLDFGIEEYFDSGSPCFMEWPVLIEPLLPDETMKLSITVAPDGSRIIEPVDAVNPPASL
jgi:tRNA threonylcarbamoyladenosine biosynthesis protein TsaE